MQLDISKIKLLFVYVVYMYVVSELKLTSAFSESGWLAYDGLRDKNHRGEAQNMFFAPIFTRRKIYRMRVLLTSSMTKLRADKASEPDCVDPKLLKSAGDSIIPSLLSVFNISSTCNTVPATWKAANISAPYKSDSETDKHNYRPISLLSVPGKLMESMVASTITTHVPGQGLGNPPQWVFDAIPHSILLRKNSPATFSQYPRAQRLSVRK